MYNIGDAVFHPTNGAGIITKVEDMPAICEGQTYYQIRMLGRDGTVLRIPVATAEDLGLRPALCENEVVQILDILSAEPEELPELHKDRYRECQDRLDTGDTRTIAALVRDLAWRRTVSDRLNAPGHRIFKSAIWLLAGELAVSQDTSVQASETQIQDALKRVTQMA